MKLNTRLICDPFLSIRSSSGSTGGIHLPNLPFLLHATLSPTYLSSLSGIAVISDIISSPDPRLAASRLKACIEDYRQVRQSPHADRSVWGRGLQTKGRDIWLDAVVGVMKLVKERKPLAHQVRLARYQVDMVCGEIIACVDRSLIRS
jgi:hypothetical protein